MRTYLLLTTLAFGMTTAAFADMKDLPPEPCQYTLLQNLVRDARSHEQIFELIQSGVSMDDKTITCGGTLLQLAVLRGNPSIVNGILVQDKERANKNVPTKGFGLENITDKIPAVLFAARFAPSEVVFETFIKNEANIFLKDTKGHDILWYLERNPVLRKTKIVDDIITRMQNTLLNDAKAKREMERLKSLDPPQEEEKPEKPLDINGDTFTLPEENIH